MDNSNIVIQAPCFSCQFAYECKYWRNNLWTSWILSNNECPAFTYQFDSLRQAILKDAQEKKEKEKYSPPPGHFDPFKGK